MPLAAFTPKINKMHPSLPVRGDLFSISIAEPEDFQSVEMVDQAAFVKLDQWKPVLWQGMLKSAGTRVLFARRQKSPLTLSTTQQIIGFVVFERGGRVMKLAVLPAWQGHGAGAMLLDAALTALETGFSRPALGSSLHVEPGNDVAVRLYESRGFAVDCTVSDYYAPGRDAFRMLRNKR